MEKTLKVYEEDLREQIASDIKAFVDSVDLYKDQDLIDIVRGKNV